MTTKTPELADAFARSPDKPVTVEVGAAKQAPSRRGRRAVTFYTDPEAHQQLRILGVETGESTQALMTEALNALFTKHGKPPVA